MSTAGALPKDELARALGMTPGALQAALDQLQEMGCLTLSKMDPADGSSGCNSRGGGCAGPGRHPIWQAQTDSLVQPDAGGLGHAGRLQLKTSSLYSAGKAWRPETAGRRPDLIKQKRYNA